MPKPTPDLNGIKEFLKYRKQGFTYRKIGKIMGKDTKTLYRWANYSVGKISTLDVLVPVDERV